MSVLITDYFWPAQTFIMKRDSGSPGILLRLRSVGRRLFTCSMITRGMGQSEIVDRYDLHLRTGIMF